MTICRAGGGGGSKNNSVIGSGTVAIGVNPTDDKKAEPIYYDEIKTNEFSDIKDIAWAKDAINKLSKKGIINGKGDNLFAPYDNITREEFASILVRLLGVNEVSSDINFSDVSDSAWYA
ncbi:MAG: S-layer homology domain-containing protein, partial [Bacteroidales bacterium]|nr:S-layer homology domain-containing protein [Bacteroidales bacterium]